MKAQIGLFITEVAGAALLVYRRWKQRSGQEYVPVMVSPSRNDAAHGINKNVAYHAKGNRHQ
ncbi:hypothetical protein D3C87_218820 [compost metagenome]